jgi:hypothetical protein
MPFATGVWAFAARHLDEGWPSDFFNYNCCVSAKD